MRERVDYRDLLQRLDERYPDRELLSRSDVAAFLGTSRQTVYNRYSDKFPARVLLSKTQVARTLAGG